MLPLFDMLWRLGFSPFTVELFDDAFPLLRKQNKDDSETEIASTLRVMEKGAGISGRLS